MIGRVIAGLALLGVTAGVTAGVTQSNANVKIKDLENKNTELIIKYENEKSDKEKYYEALQESAKTLEAKEILIQNLTLSLNTTQSELNSVKNNLSLKQSELDNKISQLNEANANITSLQNQLNSVTEDKTAIQNQLNTAFENISILESQIATLTSERDALLIQINELTEENNTLKNTIVELQKQIEDLTKPKTTSASLFTFNGNAVTGYIGSESEEEIIIPTSYSIDSGGNFIDGSDYEVTQINANNGESGFKTFTGTIRVLGNITAIGENTFYGCNMKKVVIDNGVTTIGKNAFYDCMSLKEVNIPESIVNIGLDAFNNMMGMPVIEKVNIINLSTWCGITFENCFSNPLAMCENLYLNDTLITDLVIPNEITKINNYAFYGCNATSLNLNNVQILGKQSFVGLYITTLNIPNGVTVIPNGCFSTCRNLTNITLPDSLNTIKGNAFKYCKNLTEITIPISVTSITSTRIDGADASVTNAPFYSCNENLIINCKIDSKPEGWDSYWDNYDASTKYTVNWGVTKD